MAVLYLGRVLILHNLLQCELGSRLHILFKVTVTFQCDVNFHLFVVHLYTSCAFFALFRALVLAFLLDTLSSE